MPKLHSHQSGSHGNSIHSRGRVFPCSHAARDDHQAEAMCARGGRRTAVATRTQPPEWRFSQQQANAAHIPAAAPRVLKVGT